ncbi:hypothetical protein QZH41_004674 [Actinostola sp. cb2023]|nr:hypothetical protein QZH41_004674 [Actinostola sp. cb2023]
MGSPLVKSLPVPIRAQHAKDEVVGEVSDKPHRLDGIALAELVSYIDDSCTSDTTKLPVFKLADLARMYQSCREQLSKNSDTRVNTSRLKERILMHVPELEAYNKGRDIYLALKKDVGAVLQKVHMEDCDEEAMHLAKTAAILRKDMFANKYSFTGSFEPHSQANSIPASLLSFVNMVLYGPNIETQTHSSSKGQAGLTISQLLQYNSYLRRRDGEVKHERRNKSRETPLPIYVGLSIHAKTRSRDLVENMHDLGLSVSYDRVLAISTDLGNEVCRRYKDEGAVCPSNLRLDLFTTAAVDNIDHNPSSTTAHDSFHGTGISLFQHPTTEEPDQAKSVAMIRHSMDIIKLSVNHLNPGQVPVIAFDQPLYAVAKEIQWNWREKYGEDKFVIMFGGLHIEMAFLKLIGGWLEDSGWTTSLVEANIASSGTAESFIKATSVTRTRRAHQKKSELADCLKTHTTPLTEMPGDIDVTIIDGAVVVNMVKPGIDERTFSEYATGSFIPYIKAQLRHVRRLDVIWDEYVENSLKATTR